MAIGKGGVIAAGALVLAAGAIGYRLMDAEDSPAAAAVPADPLTALEADAKANPGDAGAWQRLGIAYFDAGRFADAADAYGKASEADPGNAALWSSLGEALVMASERDPMPDRARDAFRKAVSLDAKDPRGRYFLAVAKDLTGDHQGAIGDWIALLADTPPGAPWEADLVRTIEQVGKINDIEVAKRIADARGSQPEPAAGHPAFDAIPGPSQEQLAAAGSIPPGEQRAMAEGMVAKLESRLAGDPSNIDGWIMLMRSRKTLGQDAAAAKALTAAIAANPSRKAELEAAASQLGISR
ncbi:formate-dependent nitrite reductase complex subunit NrfG [Tsuneonella dongtanensis]|uniref:Formate-dependent nitrite reductase complex subunit NrfG n=1 Tax=Tsuneonella dongtanensis TaxID=692370 RepID=A0A1B2A8Y5_9SPHN|nr:tetratricopeptide repeat protein [Tsuneonella dongtanensis]ANY18592.1 formate-dependent nitrite reductase complex subunit NrfG [Tsuneonella dongtanensis]